MPTCALPLVHDTRRKTGAPLGKVPSFATRETTPLTEIATVGPTNGVVLVGVVEVGGLAPGGTTLGGVGLVVVCVVVVVAPGVVVVGVVVVAPAPGVLPVVVASDEPAVEPVLLDTCGANGFFVSKTLNETSCPAAEGGGASLFTNWPEDGLAVAAVEAPEATFGKDPSALAEPVVTE